MQQNFGSEVVFLSVNVLNVNKDLADCSVYVVLC